MLNQPPQTKKKRLPRGTLQRPIRTKDKAERRFLQWQRWDSHSVRLELQTQQVIPSVPPNFIRLLRGGDPRGGVSLIFPKVPQSSNYTMFHWSYLRYAQLFEKLGTFCSKPPRTIPQTAQWENGFLPSDKVSAMRTFKVKANIAFSNSTSQDASSRSQNLRKWYIIVAFMMLMMLYWWWWWYVMIIIKMIRTIMRIYGKRGRS